MDTQTKAALLVSPPPPATLVIITVFSAWLSEISLHLNFTLSPAHLGGEILIPIWQGRK